MRKTKEENIVELIRTIQEKGSNEKPLQKLVTDIFYIPIRSGRCFFCPILELYNREIVSYLLYQSIQLKLIKQLLHKL
ncbi:MAG: hypothetical protein ACQ5SW_02020 [Sphaerochaetaceae bacterium]